MKKLLLTLSVLCGMFLVLKSEDIKANSFTVGDEYLEIDSFDDVLNVNSTNVAWRIWHQTGPINYVGQTKYVRTTKHSYEGQSVCYDGYLGARNMGFGKFVYEGYLYVCGGNKPIPAKRPVELDTLSIKLSMNFEDKQGVA